MSETKSLLTDSVRKEARRWRAMNPEIKVKWLRALRSGVYPQGMGTLRHDGAYCCLGVLCDVIDGWADQERVGIRNVLSDKNQNIVGFTNKDDDAETYETRISQMSLSTLNDVAKWNFDAIADFIEERL